MQVRNFRNCWRYAATAVHCGHCRHGEREYALLSRELRSGSTASTSRLCVSIIYESVRISIRSILESDSARV
jgi:hypothetical protein